jgi:GNAT superfamily N-acetyltransferase
MSTTDTPTTSLRWVKDDDPRWDADRERIFGGVPEGVFRSEARTPGERLTSDWWRVEDGDRVVAYGWLDDVWGDAEILLAVDESARGTGVGAFTLARLEEEAAARGLNYVVNVVRDTHPDRAAVTEWFLAHGFTGTDDGRLRKRVGDAIPDIGQRNAGRPGTGRFEPDEAHRVAYEAARKRATARPRVESEQGSGTDLGPGAEERGGYVDAEHHRF